MKRLILTFVMCLGVGYLCSAQEEKQRSDNPIAYKVEVKTMDGKKIKGILFYADAEGLLMTDGYEPKKRELIRIPPEDITRINLRREGDRLKGGLIGGAIGVGLALLVTKDVTDSPASFFVSAVSREEIIYNKVVSFAITGSMIGAALTDKRAEFYTYGNKFAYLNLLDDLEPFCFMHDMTEINPEE